MHSQTFTVGPHQRQEIELTAAGRYTVQLAGPGAHAEIVGTFLLQDQQELNVEVFIVHQSAHTTAQTTLKGVALDRSHLRFFGRIVIEPGCPNVQSFLEERILLLSDQAKAEAVPELEILSDDVKCSHAASVSRVPAEHLFYLQSRGISPARAEQLVIDGFLDRVEAEPANG